MSNSHPIIIGGFYRSGTTLIRRLLDSHSNIHCGPEVKFFKDFHGHYLNDPLSHVRFFETARFYLSNESLLDIFGKAFVEFHNTAMRSAKKLRWADKNPENVLYLNEWNKILPEGFTFIHVLRHPLDALASLKEIGFDKALPPLFEDKVKLLKYFVQSGNVYEARNSSSSIRIYYEDLVNQPEKTLKGLFDKLKINWEPQVLESFFSAERIEGVEDPKTKLSISIHNLSINRWKKDLSEKEIDTAVRILGPTFEGYKFQSL